MLRAAKKLISARGAKEVAFGLEVINNSLIIFFTFIEPQS